MAWLIDSTARSKAAAVAAEVDWTPLTLRTYWRAAASISSDVATGCSPRSVVMLRHISSSVRRAGRHTSTARKVTEMRAVVRPSAHRTRRSRTVGGVGAALVLMVAGGCSSGGGGSTGTRPGVAPSSTSVRSTTTPTTPTTQAPGPETADVRQAVIDYWAASRACGQRPARCNPASFTADAGSLRATVRSFVTTLMEQQYHFALGGEGPPPPSGASDSVNPGNSQYGSFVSVETVTVDPATRAVAQTTECVYDPTPLLGPPGGDGQPTVVSVTAIPRHFEHTVYLEGGKWRVGDERVDPDLAECSFASNPEPAEPSAPPP